MKKIIVSGFVMMLGMGSLKAQAKEPFKYGLSEIPVAPFKKISINAKIDVVLVQNDTLQKVFVEGNEKLLSGISVVSRDGELLITTANGYSGKEKLQVTIPVKDLRRIDINSEAKVVALAH